jgi:hypothetical protein
MNELHFAFRIRQQLNSGLQKLDDDQLERLKAAREKALAVQKQPAANPVFAAAGHFFRFHFDGMRTRHILSALAVAVALAFYAHWQAEQLIDDLSNVDSALLSEDLPVEALLDKDFDKWLKSSNSQAQ